MKKLITPFFLLAFALNTLAQCPTCEALLTAGAQDEYSEHFHSKLDDLIAELFNHDYSYWENQMTTNHTAFESGGQYYAISGFLNGSRDRSTNVSRFESLRSEYQLNHKLSTEEYHEVHSKIASKSVMDAFVACLNSPACGDDFLSVTSTAPSNSQIIVTLAWRHPNNSDPAKTVTNIATTNLRYVEGNLRSGATIKGQNSLSSTYALTDDSKEAYIKVDVSGTGNRLQYLVINPVPKIPPASDYPIGTIIASMLGWSQFCLLNHQDEVLDFADHLHCKWCPADGRLVAASEYGRLMSKVPDLRGIFLRALNDFDVPGVPTVDPRQGELDSHDALVTRPAGDLETDAVGAHSHLITVLRDPRLGYRGVISGAGYNSAEEFKSASSYKASTEPFGTETRPKNVTVYYYIKIN